MMGWMIAVNWAARLIFLLLVVLSIWSISIILNRRRYFRSWKNLEPMLDLKGSLAQQKDRKPSVDDPRWNLVAELKSAKPGQELSLFTAFVNESVKNWQTGLGVLGTLGATAPFIGLLGTILGIIVSFGELSQGQIDMKGVMFSLAEALLLTAVGLGVALPAVVGFNYFNKCIREMVSDLETTKEYYLAFSKKAVE